MFFATRYNRLSMPWKRGSSWLRKPAKYFSPADLPDSSTPLLAVHAIREKSRMPYPCAPRLYQNRAPARPQGSPSDTPQYTRGILYSSRPESYTARSTALDAQCKAQDKP